MWLFCLAFGKFPKTKEQSMWVPSRQLGGLLKVGSSRWGYKPPTFFGGGGGGQYITLAFSGSPTWGATKVATYRLPSQGPQNGEETAALSAQSMWLYHPCLPAIAKTFLWSAKEVTISAQT